MKRIFLKALISVPLCLAVVTSLIAAEPWIEVAGGKWDPAPKCWQILKLKSNPMSDFKQRHKDENSRTGRITPFNTKVRKKKAGSLYLLMPSVSRQIGKD
jgi:hypothetical protein